MPLHGSKFLTEVLQPLTMAYKVKELPKEWGLKNTKADFILTSNHMNLILNPCPYSLSYCLCFSLNTRKQASEPNPKNGANATHGMAP